MNKSKRLLIISLLVTATFSAIWWNDEKSAQAYENRPSTAVTQASTFGGATAGYDLLASFHPAYNSDVTVYRVKDGTTTCYVSITVSAGGAQSSISCVK